MPDGTIVLEERKITGNWDRVEVRWTLIREDRTCEHRFQLRLFSARELTTLLTDVGFAEIRCFGSLDGAPYDEKAERLVIVARKSGEP